MSVFELVWMRRREISGERRRAEVRKAMPVKINGAGQHIAAAGEQRASEGGIEKIFLGQFPGDHLPRLSSVVARRIDGLSVAAPTERGYEELRPPGTRAGIPGWPQVLAGLRCAWHRDAGPRHIPLHWYC